MNGAGGAGETRDDVGSARRLAADFFGFSRRRSAVVIGLIFGGAVLEGAGIVMLVPIVSLILGGGAPSQAEPVFAALGLATPGARIVAVLGVFALLLALRFVVLLRRDDALAGLQLDFVKAMRIRAFRALAGGPWSEVSRVSQGPAGHALTRDVDRVGFGVGMIVHGSIALVMLLVQLALALALAPAVTLVVAALGLGLFRALRWLRERAGHHGRELTAEDLALYQSVGGFLGGLKPARAHGLEREYLDAFVGAAERVAARHRAYAWEGALGRLLLQTASGGIGILAILTGVFALDTPPENLVVTLIILARLYSPLQAVQNALQGIRHAAAAYAGARAIAGTPAEEAEPDRPDVPAPPAAPPLDAAPAIAFEAAGLRKPGGGAILADVSLRIPAGTVTLVAGDSGAGKSTLCDLAVGLQEPDAGRVTLDGAALDPALAARLRASVAYVGQEPFLLEDSLRRNLAWGCGPVTDGEIWDALEVVGAAEIARGLEGCLDGRVRADGAPFSGGERQRLRLARALLRRPRLLVLDEATSALDPDAESQVLEAVLSARDGATVILVTHRPETRRFAGQVVTLAGGRVAGISAGFAHAGAAAPPGREK